MPDHDKINNLLTFLSLLSQPVGAETPERLKTINECVHELAHEIGKRKWNAKEL